MNEPAGEKWHTVAAVHVQVHGYTSAYVHRNARVSSDKRWYVIADADGTVTRYPVRRIVLVTEEG